jgi:hypothetical protein
MFNHPNAPTYAIPQQHMNVNHMLSPRAPATHHFTRKDSKLNKFMSILHRSNRIDPRKTLESSSSVWKDMLNASPPPPTTPRQQDHHQRASFVLPPPLIDTPMIESPKLSSWLPGLFHFKQPKVCSLECEARDEREAIGKVSQVLHEVSIQILGTKIKSVANMINIVYGRPNYRATRSRRQN